MNKPELIAMIISITSGLLSFTTQLIPPNLQSTISTVAGVGCTFTAIIIFFKSNKYITFKNLNDGQIIKEFETINKDGEIRLKPLSFYYSSTLRSNESIVLFMRVTGSQQGWISGSPVRKIDMNGHYGKIGMVTIGKPNDNNKYYDLTLLATTNTALEAGANLDGILPPDQIICSRKITVAKDITASTQAT